VVEKKQMLWENGHERVFLEELRANLGTALWSCLLCPRKAPVRKDDDPV
jgi:hypothetical protein